MSFEPPRGHSILGLLKILFSRKQPKAEREAACRASGEAAMILGVTVTVIVAIADLMCIG